MDTGPATAASSPSLSSPSPSSLALASTTNETKTTNIILSTGTQVQVVPALPLTPTEVEVKSTEDDFVSSCPLCGKQLPWSQLLAHTAAERHAAHIRLMDKWLTSRPVG
jgi:hypothetical protein